jgi:hypothetical protein
VKLEELMTRKQNPKSKVVIGNTPQKLNGNNLRELKKNLNNQNNQKRIKMKKIINNLHWILDYYFLYFIYNANKINKYDEYMVKRWGNKYLNKIKKK